MNLVSQLIERDKREPKSIVIIGDEMVDRYIYGEVSKCQEGCHKLVEKKRITCFGGVANAENSLSNWVAKVQLFGALHSSWRSVKTRYMLGNECLLRCDEDMMCGDPAFVSRTVMTKFTSHPRPDAVLMSDYDKGTLSPELICSVIGFCAKYGIPCVVDAKREPALYEGAIIKGNVEYQHKYNKELSNQVYDNENPGDLIITDGPSNPLVWQHGKVLKGFAFLRPVPMINHVGAGDCFAAHLVLALAHSYSLKEAAAIAHSAGRVYVQKPHNTPPALEDIEADFASAM